MRPTKAKGTLLQSRTQPKTSAISPATRNFGQSVKYPEDIKITAAIRRAIVADKSLTITATNVKIITADGKVTLRSPVNTNGRVNHIGPAVCRNRQKRCEHL
jgi:osmotically-inducible protein OsmY